MKNSARYFVGILISGVMLTGLITSAVMAQDKAKDAKSAPEAKVEKGKATVKVLLENDKVRVTETRYMPGDVNVEAPVTSYRVNRTLQGGTLQRTYADGKTEKSELKTGMVRYIEPAKSAGGKYTVKNIGNTDVVSYVVVLK